jgi:hypothetical protein
MTDDPQGSGTPDDIDALGAAATRPADGARKARRRPGARSTKAIGRRRFLFRAGIVLLVVVGLALVPLVRSSLEKTPTNRVGISYGGGPIEAVRFQRIVQPGSNLFFNGFLDRFYLYPSDTQTYIVSEDPAQGDVKQADSIVAPSRDRVQIEYQVAVYFKLNTDRLRDFHEQLGLQYSAYTPAGWRQLIQDTFRQQIENVLQEETRKHDVADLYGDAAVLTQIQDEIEANLGEGLIGALGQPYVCGPTFRAGEACDPPTFIIKKVDIPEDVAASFEDNRTSQIKVQTRQNEIQQRAAEAEAIKALNEGLAEAGMPYVMLKAIESGKVSFWVLPSEGGVTLQAPDAAGTTPEGGSPPTTTTPGGG